MDNETQLKKMIQYQCLSCYKPRDCSRFICSSCVNDGRFCLPQHKLCTSRRFEELISLLNKNDSIEFEEYIKDNNLSRTQIQCFYAMFVLKKIRLEEQSLRNQFQLKWKSFFRMNLMIEEMILRKRRIIQAQQQASVLRASIEKKEQLNSSTRNHIETLRLRIENIKQDIAKQKEETELRKDKINKHIKHLEHSERRIRRYRRECLQQLQDYICPIELVSTIDGDLARRMKALSDAAKDNDSDEDEATSNDITVKLQKAKYRILNSFLSMNGDDAIDNLVDIYNTSNEPIVAAEPPVSPSMESFVFVNDNDSPQLTPSTEAFENLTAFSYACLLTNALAEILDVQLPYRLHQIEFNPNQLAAPKLRASISKLNENIACICVTQNIPVQNKETCTLENLYNILHLATRSSAPVLRSEDFTLPSNYMVYLESVVTNVDGELNTGYWFDPIIFADRNTANNSAVESDLTNTSMSSDSHQYDSSVSTITNSDQLQTSEMSDSTGLLTKSSGFIRSLFGGWQ